MSRLAGLRRWRALGTAAALAAGLAATGCAHSPGASAPDGALRQPPADGKPLEGATTPPAPGGPTTAAAPAAPGNWEGRLSLKLHARGQEPARGIALAFSLQGTAQQGRLDLSTPLGTQVAAVSWREDEALLETSDGRRPYPSLDLLTQEVLGEALPVQAMLSWLAGRPDPAQPWQPASTTPGSSPQAPAADATPSRFEQAGWTVDLARLPQQGQIEAARPSTGEQRGADLKVRLMR